MKFSKSSRINVALYHLGIYSYRDILFYLPKKYDDFSPSDEEKLLDKSRVVLVGRILKGLATYHYHKASLVQFSFLTQKMNVFYIKAWNRPYLSTSLNSEDYFTLVGNFDKSKNVVNLISINKGIQAKEGLVKPVYSLPKSLDNFEFVRLVNKAFKEIKKEDIKDLVPAYFKKKYHLIDKYDALFLAHFPKNKDDVKASYRHLKYEECLLFSLKMLLVKEANNAIIKENNQPVDQSKIKNFIEDLPYKLTKDQLISLKEIIHDMDLDKAMYRLLEGDVGSGKTLVSALSLFANYTRHKVGALMAPTEALAKQHYLTLTALFKNSDVRIGLLLGSTPLKERSLIRQALLDEKIDILVGTHALFSKDINYSSLGLVIIDEQHKFGVNQRHLLSMKGDNCDLLMLSATPIPRSLALTIYGDLDVSTLFTFPYLKKDVETIIVSSNNRLIDQYISSSIACNGRIYIIAPRIENVDEVISVEKLYEKFKQKYPTKVSLLHGKLSEDDKNFALDDFRQGITPILVSTSVIEVGIDVKEADLMIVYEPTFFGLASLHQLRGRIGRNGQKAHFLMVYDGDDIDDLNKLNVLVNSNDGFKISEEDLRYRGPGEFNGLKQSGLVSFMFASILNDYKMFVISKEDAKFILKNRNEYDFKSILNKAKALTEEEDIYRA